MGIVAQIAPGRDDLVAVIESFFDESFDKDLFCVAGYVFKKSKLQKFDAEWLVLLRDFGLDYFRMSECAPDPGYGKFAKLSKEQRIIAASRAIGLIKRYASVGIAICVRNSDFQQTIFPNEYFSTPYQMCAWVALVAVRSWADKNQQPGSIGYAFEAGHSDEGKANVLMSKIFKEENLRNSYRYTGHAFVPKEKNRPSQAADLLAWHYFRECKRINDGEKRPQRKDYLSLIELPHQVMFSSSTGLQAFMGSVMVKIATGGR